MTRLRSSLLETYSAFEEAVPVIGTGAGVRFAENVPEGALIDAVVRFDASAGFVLVGSGTRPSFKVLSTDPPFRVLFPRDNTTALLPDGTDSGTFRIWGFYTGGASKPE